MWKNYGIFGQDSFDVIQMEKNGNNVKAIMLRPDAGVHKFR